MSNHVLNIDPFDPASIQKALDEIEKVQKELPKKVDNYIGKLTDIGVEAARAAYSSEVLVDAEFAQGVDGYAIFAEGPTVAFEEFGAGLMVNPANRFAGQMPFRVARGSWSDERNGPYKRSNYDHWTYNNVEYTEIAPRAGMQKAYEAIMQNRYQARKEIFGQ